MTHTYYVTYYVDKKSVKFSFAFESQFGACYKARMIRDAYGYATDVTESETGAILAIFEPNGRNFVDELDIEPDARKIAALDIN